MSSSTDQTQDDMAGKRRFGHDPDDDVLEGQLIEPAPVEDRVDEDPDSPVDDPIVMDTAPVDPEEDRVVLDSHNDPQDASTPATPAAARMHDSDGAFVSSGDRADADYPAAGSAIPMPGGPAGEVAPVAETTPVTETTPDREPLVSEDVAPVGENVVPADVPAPSPVPVAETGNGTTAQSPPGDSTAVPSRTTDTEQWHEILAMFVDDPRAATQRAASLVDSSVEALLSSVKDQQQSLQSDWQGDGADTEKLRNALQHYRSFWTRLEQFSHQA